MLISTQAVPVAAATAPADAAVSIHHRTVPRLGADFRQAVVAAPAATKAAKKAKAAKKKAAKAAKAAKVCNSFPHFKPRKLSCHRLSRAWASTILIKTLLTLNFPGPTCSSRCHSCRINLSSFVRGIYIDWALGKGWAI
jgi:hypothetical protein